MKATTLEDANAIASRIVWGNIFCYEGHGIPNPYPVAEKDTLK
jgi:hypothetical protein